ncbi:glycosyltransferase [Candidatus Altiarchaeota archaeon]
MVGADIGVFRDNLLLRGGAERTSLKVKSLLDADMVTSGFNPECFAGWDTSQITDIGNLTASVKKRVSGYPGFDSFYRVGFLETACRFRMYRGRRDFGVNIFSGFYSIFAAEADAYNVWYCHSPNRTLYDLWDDVYYSKPWMLRPLWDAYSRILRPLDQEAVKDRMDLIICESDVVRRRVKEYYGLDPKVLFGPVTTSRFQDLGVGDYYLAVNRLIPEKRVDVIVSAFKSLPSEKLVVVGDGPLRARLEEVAADSGNIVFKGLVDEQELLRLYGGCKATVYLPVAEDFGLIPVESNACGKPCITVEEGGCSETVRDGKTGFFIEPTPGALAECVKSLDDASLSSMADECLAWSVRFDDQVFREKLSDLIGSHG